MQAGTKPSPQSPPDHDLIEFEQEQDGRWIAELPSVLGVMAYGTTRTEAESKALALFALVRRDRADSPSTS